MKLIDVGVRCLLNFEIGGDVGGEDPQVQVLSMYQAFGGLPSKEYYEEEPVLDLYQSVVKGILIQVASNTKNSAPTKRPDLLEGWTEELTEEEAGSWLRLGVAMSGEPEGGKKGKEKPLEVRMDRLAAQVVHFERQLVRAGADPEHLYNAYFNYNPYSTERVSKALPFLDIPLYLSTFAPRAYPVSITVTHPPYLKAVTRLVEATPDYVLSGYFATRLAMSYAPALGPDVPLRQEVRRLEEVLGGLKRGTEQNRHDVCLNRVNDIVGFIAGREFVKTSFSSEAKADVEHIIASAFVLPLTRHSLTSLCSYRPDIQ
jgi:endothelin-converting enzyme